MKALIILIILSSFSLIIFQYKRKRDIKKLFLSTLSMLVLILLGVVGMMTRSIPAIFLAHILLLIVAWGSLLYYLWKGCYYWWIILSPLLNFNS